MTNLKSYKTPLRYPGGKSRAVKFLKGEVPSSFTEYREPFLGGASMAIHITKEHPNMSVWVNDLYYNLYNFWTQLRDNGSRFHEELVRIRTPIDFNSKLSRKNNIPRADWDSHIIKSIAANKELFIKAKSEINTTDNLFTRAVYFYILNKCSFSGLGESSTFSEMASDQNFNLRGVNKLPEYSKMIKNWKITNLDYKEIMNAPSDNDCFVYVDPPYDIKDNLYGDGGDMHKGFNHMKFYHDMLECPHKWMITYNSNEVLRERFNQFNLTSWDLTYTMRSVGTYVKDQQERKELLITNYDEVNK
jgi:DNA adenine methylase